MHLESYLKTNSISVTSFAAIIGAASRATIYRYINGRIPAPHIMAKISQATGGQVTANDFYNPAADEVRP